MYHVNPKTGKFDICHARCLENCPFGVENHSESYDEIQIKADKINKILKAKKTTISLTEFKSMLESDSPEISNIEVIFTERDSIREIECKNKVFTNVHFPNIHNSNITDCEFNYCDFTSNNERYRNLYENTMFINCRIENSNLSEIGFANNKLQNTKIFNSNFDNSHFSSTIFKNVDFNNSSLTKTRFEEYCTLEEVDFNNCKAKEIVFLKNTLSDCKIDNSNFDYMYYEGGEGDRIVNCDFKGNFDNSTFCNAKIKNTNFDCYMPNLTIEDSSIKNVDFEDSILINIDFNKNYIEYTRFREKIKGGTIKECKLNNTLLKGSFNFEESYFI